MATGFGPDPFRLLLQLVAAQLQRAGDTKQPGVAALTKPVSHVWAVRRTLTRVPKWSMGQRVTRVEM